MGQTTVHHGFQMLQSLRMFGSAPGETGYVFKLYGDETAVTDGDGLNVTVDNVLETARCGKILTITTMGDVAAALDDGTCNVFKVTSIDPPLLLHPAGWTEISAGGYTPLLIKFGSNTRATVGGHTVDTFNTLKLNHEAAGNQFTLWDANVNQTTSTGDLATAYSGISNGLDQLGIITTAANSSNPLSYNATFASISWTFTGAITGGPIKKVGVYSLSTGLLCFSEVLDAASWVTPLTDGDRWTFTLSVGLGGTSGSLT